MEKVKKTEGEEGQGDDDRFESRRLDGKIKGP